MNAFHSSRRTYESLVKHNLTYMLYNLNFVLQLDNLFVKFSCVSIITTQVRAL